MSSSERPCALIAEDEPVLARTLARLLRQVWPQLQIAAVASDGVTAIAAALEHTPQILFLDIRMPGRSGLEVAEAVADDWPDAQPVPLIVFVTAFDQFAMAAFERAAVDYVLKPVTAERLAITVQRLQQRLAVPVSVAGDEGRARLMEKLQSISAPASPESTEPIRMIRAGVGNTVRMIPVAEVICLEATQKYVNVITASGESLVRLSLRDLSERIDGIELIQVHRGVLVNAGAIVSATRDENGHYSLALRGLQRPVKVSRAFGHLFRAM